ncbi:glycoside hydrolase family 10 [Lecanosticta acicola]|uniref:Beta-xylanase n=1 Tax=Lecanosticta acicola TaxID=111012 RepID=A0AAI9EFD1_9PEZI|nr:glycoside hydrolase family 10 [Lecanosticta acicola]
MLSKHTFQLCIAAVPVLAVSTSASSLATNTNPTTTLFATATGRASGLNAAAKKSGKLWFGTAADIPGTNEINDPYYMKEFNNSRVFGEATPANAMKFDATEPQQNMFDFTGAERFLEVSEASHKLVRCHNLIWGSQIPSWVTNPSTPWTNATLSAVLKNHVQTLVKHFGDRCYSWDVVNEAFSDSPAGSYLDNFWYNNIGPEYVPMAFKAAADAVKENNLKVKLYYNDYNIEYAGNKSTAAQNLVQELQSRGIQIDGVGLESHFIAGETPSQEAQESNMNAFTALGVDVAVTELDVRLTLPPTAASEAQQVQDYYSTVAACRNVQKCIGVTVWDFVDTYSWVPSTFAGQGYADLFFQPQGQDTTLVKKAAYDGCLEALTGKVEGV